MGPKTTKKSADVLVIGAGPTGLTMAHELVRHGAKVRIIDKAAAPSIQSKALAIQVRTLEILEHMGLIKEVVSQGQEIKVVNASMEGHQIAKVEFEGLDSPHPFPIMLEQSHTEAILIESLKKLGVEVERQVELTNFSQDKEKVTAQLRHKDGKEETVNISWLAGCDGAHSIVRHLLDLPFHGAPYPETFILADVKVDWELSPNELHIFLKHEGVMGVFPMKEDKRFRIIGIRPPGDSDFDQDPTLKEIQNLVSTYAPGEGKVYDPVWLAKFHLHRRGVPQYKVGRCFVAGDAAHIHSPVGGQGMNTGIQDAYNLAWKLAWVSQGIAKTDILDSYSPERQPIGAMVLKTTDRMFDMIVSTNPVLKFFRNYIFPHVAPVLSKAAGQKLAEFISEINVRYRNSLLSSEQPVRGEMLLRKGPHAGDRVVDAPLKLASSGKVTRLYEVLSENKHVLLAFSGKKKDDGRTIPWDDLVHLAEGEFGKVLSIYQIQVEDDKNIDKIFRQKVLIDESGEAHEKYGAEGGAIYLIRPDGYVAYRSGTFRLQALLDYLERFYGEGRV